MRDMVEIKDVICCYDDLKQKAADVPELVIESGSIVALLGENGAGKTTLLKAICGLMPLVSGSILIDGKPPRDAMSDIAFITEEISLFGFLNAQEMKSFLMPFYPKFNEERYEVLLRFFDIDMEKPIAQMSKGQQAKVEVAVGFSKGASLLLLDEPFLGKDLFTRRDFLKLMKSSLLHGETIVICTHQIDEIQDTIDRAVVMSGGKIAGEVDMQVMSQSSLAQELARLLHYDSEKLHKLEGAV